MADPAATQDPGVAIALGRKGELTQRQSEILTFIFDTIQEVGYQPSHREIMEKFGIRATNASSTHLKSMERKGYLVVIPNHPRGLRLLRWPDGSPFTGLARPKEEG